MTVRVSSAPLAQDAVVAQADISVGSQTGEGPATMTPALFL
jgi:hypothetical protein